MATDCELDTIAAFTFLVERDIYDNKSWCIIPVRGRVAKCHGYDGYIRVKIFAGWGKKSGKRCNMAKFRLFVGKISTIMQDFYV